MVVSSPLMSSSLFRTIKQMKEGFVLCLLHFVFLLLVQVHDVSVPPDQVSLRVLRVKHPGLPRAQTGAAAATEGVVEDEDAGEDGGEDVHYIYK